MITVVVRARRGLARAARVMALLLAVVIGGALVSCASPRSTPAQQAATPASTRTSSAASGSSTSSSAGPLYVAVDVREAGRAASWLPRYPIRLWFEQLNGARTAILDAPVNTYSVPALTGGGLLWTGKESSGTGAGCVRVCNADGFVGRITSNPARGSWAHGLLTITAGRDVAVFAPTSAPVPERSTCDRSSIDLFPCARLVTVSGTENGTVVGALRSSPLTASIDGTGKQRVITFSDGARTIRAPIRVLDGQEVTAAGSARTTGSCSPNVETCRTSRFVETMLTTTVTYQVHVSSILMTSRHQTLQLEAR